MFIPAHGFPDSDRSREIPATMLPAAGEADSRAATAAAAAEDIPVEPFTPADYVIYSLDESFQTIGNNCYVSKTHCDI
jgi:hypothetical protein